MKWNRNASTVFVGVVMVLMGISFTVGTLSLLAQQSQPGLPTLSKERIAVMPFIKGRYGSDIRETLRCPLCNLSFEPEDLTFNCDQILTRYVQEALERHHEDMAIPFAQVQAAYEQIAMDATKDTPVTLAQRLGKEVDAEYVLLGTVWRYREREGGSRGVQKPASVSFSVHLIRSADGKFIWERTFAETQRSLSENVLEARAFFERGAKWLTADELARYGVDEIMKDFPH